MRLRTAARRVVVCETATGALPSNGIDLEPYVDNIDLIRRCIESGTAIPERFYRKSRGRDHLLEDQGIYHLHIGVGIDDDVLLFVEDLGVAVVFIAVTDHGVFDERPRGKRFRKIGILRERARRRARIP